MLPVCTRYTKLILTINVRIIGAQEFWITLIGLRLWGSNQHGVTLRSIMSGEVLSASFFGFVAIRRRSSADRRRLQSVRDRRSLQHSLLPKPRDRARLFSAPRDKP